MKKTILLISIASVYLIVFLILPVFGSTTTILPPKPDVLSVASWGIEGGSYAQYAAVGEGMQNKFGIKLRLIPCSTDTARVAMMLGGRVDFSGIGGGAYWAVEGLGDFAEIEWGPQELRLVYECRTSDASALAVRADSGIKTFADLKGKRVAYIVGSPGINSVVEASLAWAGLSWDDVIKVEYRSTEAAFNGPLEGTCDTSMQSSMSPIAYKMEASPHGIYWIPMPPENKEGWKRFNETCPYYRSALLSIGAGLSEEHPVWLAAYSFPTMFTTPSYDESKAYWMIKAVWESYPLYKDVMPVMKNWNLIESGLKSARLFPWHEGSVKYLKEVGLWTEKLQRNQDALVQRQKALVELWKSVLDEAADKKVPREKFVDFWKEKRAEKFPSWYEPLD